MTDKKDEAAQDAAPKAKKSKKRAVPAHLKRNSARRGVQNTPNRAKGKKK